MGVGYRQAEKGEKVFIQTQSWLLCCGKDLSYIRSLNSLQSLERWKMSQKEEKERDRGRRTEEGKLLFCLKLVELDMRNEWRMKKRRVWYFIERIDKLCLVLDCTHIQTIQPELWLSLWFQILIFISTMVSEKLTTTKHLGWKHNYFMSFHIIWMKMYNL